MTGPFGDAARVGLASARPRTTPEDLVAAIREHRHDHVRLVADLTRGAVRILDGDADVTIAPLSDLAAQMTRARIAPHAIGDALTAWADQRPATVAEARARGHLVLDWADPACTSLAWSIAVPRPGGTLAPLATPLLPPAEIAALRETAAARSAQVAFAQETSGAITLITTTPAALSTAALAHPDLAGRGDVLFVITPGAPVAYGPPDALARLAATTNVAHQILPADGVPDPLR